MSRRRHEFNPFIVLSDVTMATLVVVCCMLMIYLHFALRRAEKAADTQRDLQKAQRDLKQAQRDRDEAREKLKKHDKQLQQIKTNQSALKTVMDNMGSLGTGLTYSWSKGTTTVMFRICGETTKVGRGHSLFEEDGLTPEGAQACKSFASRLLANNTLKNQMFSEKTTTGYLTEIQIQGHCVDENTSDPWNLTVNRALAVKSAMSSVRGFPISLVTVSGAASNRRAYRSTDDYVKGEAKRLRKDWQRLNYDEAKQIISNLGVHNKRRAQLPDRIDITFKYAGEREDDSLVPARDPITHQLLGTEIDTAHNRFDPNSYTEDKWNAVRQDSATASPSPAVAPR